ncbi:MAG: hypothetical protein K2H02_03825, partial [Anaeroplasmataceae bacterium]|nr:hypothetical protein [Anaeroplasmataceae bacterium]
IPFSISHIYLNDGIDKGYGKGFRINLEQTLIKIEGTSRYKLVLADGSEEIFEEVYYYKDTQDKRVYQTKEGQTLQRSDIVLEEDGTLRYYENIGTAEDGSIEYDKHIVYIDLKSDTGLTLKSDYKDFINSEHLNFKNEELYQLEQEIAQYKANIEDLNYQLKEYQKFEENSNYLNLEQAKKDYQECNQEVSKFQLDSYQNNEKKKDNLLDYKKEYYDKIIKYSYKVGGLKRESDGSIKFDPELERLTYRDEIGRKAEIFSLLEKYAHIEKQNDDDETVMSEEAKLASYYNQFFSDSVESINQKIQTLSFEIEQKEMKDQKELVHKQSNLLDKEKAYQDCQNIYDDEQKNLLKDYYDLLIERTEIQIKQYQLLIAQKEYQQAELYKQMPELYLYNEEGIIYGYNKFGSLCMLFDAYEHQVLIEYNEKNQIKDIIDSKNHKIDFIYNTKHQLIRIIDEEDHFIDFIYDQGYLKQFRYSNEEIFKLQYLNDNLYEVVDIDSVGYRLEYKDQLISKLQYFCATNNRIDEEISFVYEANLVSIQSNKNAIKTCYLFDDNQSLTTE